jgi:phage shock protein E
MGIRSWLFGNNKTDWKGLALQGALIVDVRGPDEFATGHIDDSINIPLETVNTKTAFLKKGGKPVIVCCRSGVRSGMALAILKAAGIEVYNGGAWDKLRQKIQ